LRLLLLLLLLRTALLIAVATAAAAATAGGTLFAGCRLPVAGCRRRGLLLLGALLLAGALLLSLLAALGVGLLSALGVLAAFRTAVALAGTGAFALAAFFALRLRGAGTLLPLPQFLLHETAPLRLGASTRLIESAVRAALPTFRISLLAMRADDALWQRHSKSARIVHFAPCPTTHGARRSGR
jgi:hypothetical protein